MVKRAERQIAADDGHRASCPLTLPRQKGPLSILKRVRDQMPDSNQGHGAIQTPCLISACLTHDKCYNYGERHPHAGDAMLKYNRNDSTWRKDKQ